MRYLLVVIVLAVAALGAITWWVLASENHLDRYSQVPEDEGFAKRRRRERGF